VNPETLDIRLNDEVLDIGSGNNPNSKATVLLDLYIKDSSHRSMHELKIDERPFVNASIEYLPFRDKIFDYVICNHVLEHVDNPVKACQEIQRVGKKGYIECPSPFLEQGYWIATDGKSHWEKHKWYVWNPTQSAHAAEKREISHKLIFQRKDPTHFDETRFAHVIRLMFNDVRTHHSQDGQNNDYINKIMSMFTPNIHHTIFHFEGSFKIEIRNGRL